MPVWYADTLTTIQRAEKATVTLNTSQHEQMRLRGKTMTLLSQSVLRNVKIQLAIKSVYEALHNRKLTVHYSVVKHNIMKWLNMVESLLNNTRQELPSFCFIVSPVKIWTTTWERATAGWAIKTQHNGLTESLQTTQKTKEWQHLLSHWTSMTTASIFLWGGNDVQSWKQWETRKQSF